MNITQRQVNLGLLTIMAVGVLLLFIGQLVGSNDPAYIASTGCGMLLFGGLLYAYWRGWEYARHCIVITTTLLVTLTLQEPFLTQHISLSVFVPPVLALILVEPRWVIGSAA